MKSLFWWGLAICITIFVIIGPGAFVLGALVVSQGTEIIRGDSFTSTVIFITFLLFFVVPILVVRKILEVSRDTTKKALEKAEQRKREKEASRMRRKNRYKYHDVPALSPDIIEGEFTEVD